MTFKIENYPGCEAAAQQLFAARDTDTPGPLLPATCRPQTLGQAFAVQQQIAQLFKARQDPIAAWKTSLPSPGRLGAAPIYASTIHDAARGPAPCHHHFVRIEPEIAFELAQDLAPRAQPYAESEIDAAINRARLALEVLGCRYASPEQANPIDLFADHLFNQGLILGPLLSSPAQAPAQLDIRLRVDGVETESRPGVHPNQHPKAGLYWLVNFLREQGLGLKAGQHVITGSYIGYIDVPANRALDIVYGDLGTLSLRFDQRTPTP